MNRNLTEDQILLRNTVRKFSEDVIKPVAGEYDEKEEFSYDITQQMAEMGFLGAFLPEEYGGSSLDYVSYIIMVEELARVDGSHAATIAAHNSLGTGPLYYFGSKEQKEKYLPLLAGGNLWGFGLTEPEAGSDAGNTQTRAYEDDGDWIVNGSKIFITNGATDVTLGSTVLAVSGQQPDGRKEFTCIIIENDTPGFEARTMKGKMMWRASNTSELYFQDCRVPASNTLGKKGDGFKQMLSTLDNGRLSIAAMGLGLAQGAYELALKYSKERKTFGRAISTYQANAFKLADIEMGLELARTYLYDVCRMLDKGEKITKEGAIAKLYCSELAHMAANHCVQILGGYGLMKEYGAERFYRDQKLLEIGEGTSEIQRLVISRLIGCYD
ncbi:MAG: acyl-CoA dehydrogenase family protein [Candidatus Kapabacteria bacterium]|nr:acyl-CoA dehydrogenase family protein [Ignavibacteriota bacterium]MCW5883459.1 acyl-CoA dehydrogenase family protein [Candidatus Kapabacteria bacterium]